MDSIDDLFVMGAIDEVEASPGPRSWPWASTFHIAWISGLSHLAALAFAVAGLLERFPELIHQQAMSVAVAALNEHASDASLTPLRGKLQGR